MHLIGQRCQQQQHFNFRRMSSGTLIIVLLLVVLSFLNQFPQSPTRFLKAEEKVMTAFRDANWLGQSWQYPLSIETIAVGASQPNQMSTSKSSSTFFTGNIVYPHDHSYWSSLARTAESYNWMDDPSVLTTHSPVWDRMLPRIGRYLPSTQPSLSKDTEEICHSLFKLWSGTADPGAGLFNLSLQFHQCPPPLCSLFTTAHVAVVAHGLATELSINKEHALPTKS